MVRRHAPAIVAIAAGSSIVQAPRDRLDDGYTWAPIFISYGGTTVLYVPVPLLRLISRGHASDTGINLSSTRWECRAVDPSTNPYLAAAMFLAAGLDGVEQDLDPGEPDLVNMYELPDQELERRGVKQLPRTLLESIEAFEADDLGRRVMGEDLFKSYIAPAAGVELLTRSRNGKSITT